MPVISNFSPLRILLIPVIGLLLWKGSTKARLFLLAAALLVALVDWINSDFIKHLFLRPRPYETMAGIHVFIYKQWVLTNPPFIKLMKNTLSFPSTHAVNVWALAVFLGRFYAHWAPAAYFTAVIVCLSRIYTGHHYPIDVVAGGILGAVIAVGYYNLLRFLMVKLDRQEKLVWLLFPQKQKP
jgi:undecaprenyl-diphosphatase